MLIRRAHRTALVSMLTAMMHFHGEGISGQQGGCIKPILCNTSPLAQLSRVLIGPIHVIRGVLRHTGDALACAAVLEDLQGCGRTGRCMAPVRAHKAPCGCKGRGERRSTCACIWAARSFCCLQNSDLMGMQVCGLRDVLLSPLLRVDAALQRHALVSECRHSSTSQSFCSCGPWADTI